MDDNRGERLIARHSQKPSHSFRWRLGDKRNRWIIYYVQYLMKRLRSVRLKCCQEVFRQPLLFFFFFFCFLTSVRCHNQFNTLPSCPPLLILGLMAFPTQTLFKVHFIAVVSKRQYFLSPSVCLWFCTPRHLLDKFHILRVFGIFISHPGLRWSSLAWLIIQISGNLCSYIHISILLKGPMRCKNHFGCSLSCQRTRERLHFQ